MTLNENLIRKIPFLLVHKKNIILFIIFLLVIFLFQFKITNFKLLITIYSISTWITISIYFLFKLVNLSGIKQYLFYSKVAGVLAAISFIKLFIVLIDDQMLLFIPVYIEKISIITMFLVIVRMKNKFNMKVIRMEPWMAAIYYLTIPMLINSIYGIIFKSESTNLINELIFIYIYFISFMHSAIVSIFEYYRLGKLQDDMQKRNSEILQFAEKANESTRIKGEFLANMSHELRTPLNGILGSATLLIGTKLNQEQRNYLETLRICGNNLLVIINEILDYSKIEANKLELEHIPFDINGSIENVFELLAPAAAAQNTELIYYIDYTVPEQTVGDYTRIQQVLTHLVDNAIKFTLNGYTYVKITAQKTLNNKDDLKFEIIDTGSGISKKDINKLFKSFSQIDDSSTRKYGGTGLGLSIAKKLTELMGGSIGVKSQTGKGSIFNFNVITDSVSDADITKNKSQKNQIQLQNKIIYTVEKNPIQLEVIRQQCEKWGMESYSAENIDDAVSIPSQIPPTFVLVSIDDFESEKLRDKLTEKYLDQQIIFIAILKNSSTYYTEDKIIPKGFASSILKPIKYSQLFDCLIETLSAKQRGILGDVKLSSSKLSDIFPLRILVAEDNVVNQKLITNMLKKFGYICDIVANGNEILEALTRNNYDIIFMDVQMPELDGIEATKKIIMKYPKSASRPRIIAMTAHARGAEGQVCLDAGMEGYLGKPIDMKELKQVLEFWGSNINKIKTSSA